MADETPRGDASGRALSRALARPVRAMSRILTGTANSDRTPDRTADGRSAIVNCALYIDGVRRPGDWAYPDALTEARRTRNGFVWLGLKEPTVAELVDIADVFDLHELSIEDAAKPGQRPKIDRYGDMTFQALRTARYGEHGELAEDSEIVESGDIMLFIGDHFVITVRHGDACKLAPVRRSLEQRKEILAHGAWAVAYGVYDLVVDVLMEVATSIEEDVSAIEEVVFSRVGGSGRIQRIYQLKRELMEFKRAVMPLQRPLSGLASGQLADVPDEIQAYFRDVYDHLTRTVEQVMYFDDLLNSILQARLAQLSVDQNNDMRKMAAWAAIAAVWTAVAGIYGMNFEFMPELHWKYSYPVVLALVTVTSMLMYRAFRRSGWL